jgi:hypothetical protein
MSTIRLRIIADEHHGDYVGIGEPQIRAIGAELKRLGLLEHPPVTIRLHSTKTGETVATSDPVEAAADALVNAMIYGKAKKPETTAQASFRVTETTETTLFGAVGTYTPSETTHLTAIHAGTGKSLATFYGPDKWANFWAWHAPWLRAQGINRAPNIDVAAGLVRV